MELAPARREVSRGASLRMLYGSNRQLILGIVSLVSLLVGWEVVGRLGLVNPLSFTFPTAIVAAGVKLTQSGELAKHFLITFQEFVYGYILAALTAIPLGIAMGRWRTIEFLLDPLVSLAYATPRIALLPLITLILGIGMPSKIFLVFIGGFFPMIINAAAGVKTVDPVILNMARVFGANEGHLFVKIILPSSVPFIIAGLRLALGVCLLMVVAAEYFSATAGVGYLIALAAGKYAVDQLFVGVVVLAIMSLFLTEAIKRAEKRIAAWREQ